MLWTFEIVGHARTMVKSSKNWVRPSIAEFPIENKCCHLILRKFRMSTIEFRFFIEVNILQETSCFKGKMCPGGSHIIQLCCPSDPKLTMTSQEEVRKEFLQKISITIAICITIYLPPPSSEKFLEESQSKHISFFGKIVSWKKNLQWTIPLKEAASLLWDFYRDPLRSLTLLSLNVLSQKLWDGFL